MRVVTSMWETSNRYRGGSKSDGGSRGNGKPRMRMKRIQAELVANNGWGVAATMVPVRLILNDLGPKSVTLFATQTLELGQQVTLTIEHPRPLLVRGKVTYT